MKNRNLTLKSSTLVITLLLFMFCTMSAFKKDTKAHKVNNIVIVHGAFADGSGFESIYNILTKKGYNVTIVQNPCTSLEDDVAATDQVLNQQDGTAILVGHSWGGTVISQAGVSSKVAGLVYIEGFAPEIGETTAQLASSQPTAKEAGKLEPNADGWIYYPKDKYHEGFAGDLSKAKSDFMYDSQVPITLKCFTTPVTEAAWKNKPSWGIVSTCDKSINPLILKTMYKRAGSSVTEIKAIGFYTYETKRESHAKTGCWVKTGRRLPGKRY